MCWDGKAFFHLDRAVPQLVFYAPGPGHGAQCVTLPQENEDGVDPALKKKYTQQLKQLAEMGLTDTARCISVLEECKGEIERAMDVLFGGDD